LNLNKIKIYINNQTQSLVICNKPFDVINAKKVKVDADKLLLKRIDFDSDEHFDEGCRLQTPAIEL